MDEDDKKKACPECGLSYAFDDDVCNHCGYGKKDLVPKKAKHKAEHIKKAMYNASIPALIVTGLIVVPLLSWMDSLESAGRLNLPDWTTKVFVIAIIGLFFLIWQCLGQLTLRFFNKRSPKDEQ